ncbi:MAG: sensor histidine kinase, partial [Promethearchaeota archaeon]
KDTGIGLTKDEMEIIFTRFGKIERIGEGLEYIDIQGSGLGLFISKEIVHLHEGTIHAESEGRHKGSTFIVKFPVN